MCNRARTIARLSILLALVSFAASQQRAAAQTTAQKMDQLMTLAHERGQFDGVVLVSERGRVLYRKAFGYANKEWNVPNTPDTKFRIASITKSFTSALVFRLIEQGKLRLEGKVTDYLPDFSKARGEKITIHHLLTHTSGLGDIGDLPGDTRFPPSILARMDANLVTTDEYIRMISEQVYYFEPGADYRYSNAGYILLGTIIEKVTGKPYAKVLEEQILTPLGMKSSGMAYHTTLVSKRAAGYEHTFYGDENVPVMGAGPAGGMYSTVDDLLLFIQALAGDGLLSRQSKEVMFAFKPYNSVYGWKVRKVTDGAWTLVKRTGEDAGDAGWKGERVIITDGLIPGFLASMVWQVEANRVIVLLTNVRLPTPSIVDLGLALTKIMDGKAYEPPKRSLAETLFAAYRAGGIEAALRQYPVLRLDRAYNLSESEMNSLGYLLLNREGKVREAVEIFS